MQRLVISSLLIALLFAGTAQLASSHCEVPCGVYDDGARFTRMLEDTTTIRKAMQSIQDLAAKDDPQSVNQVTRWVQTKGEHATHTQHVIAQYFMTQRLKPGTDEASQARYIANLTSAHAVMIAAMKCKQSADPALADALQKAIVAFRDAYGAKAK